MSATAEVAHPPIAQGPTDALAGVLARSVQARAVQARTSGEGATKLLRKTHRRKSKPVTGDGEQSVTSQEAFQEQVIATELRFARDEKEQAITNSKLKALALDFTWSQIFAAQMASYEEVVETVSGAINRATANFQTAQGEQAQTDAMAMQVIGLMAGVAFAGGFGWVFTKALGAMTSDAQLIVSLVKKLESPVNTAVSMLPNVGGVALGTADAQLGQTPSSAVRGAGKFDSAIGFMTSNRAQLMRHRKNIADAFVARRKLLDAMPAGAWPGLDLTKQAAAYQAHHDHLATSYSDADRLKSLDEVELVIERHLWASWIVNQVDEHDRAPHYRGTTGDYANGMDPDDGRLNFTLGGHVEDRLNAIHVDKLAQVKLSGHALWPNSPSGWDRMLCDWARDYKEGVNKDDDK